MNAPIIIEQFTKAAPEAVWKAITDKQIMKEWYFTIDDFELQENASFNFFEGPEKKFLHQGSIQQIVPNALLRHTWTHPQQSKGSSVVRWELIPEKDGTLIRLTHEGTENFADAGPEFSRENFEMGWKGIVQSTLKNFLNGVKTLQFETDIKASAEAIWQFMWDKANYRLWTSVFSPDSRYEGDLALGARIHFLSGINGMYSDIVYLIENKFIIFSHIGVVKQGVELPIDAEIEVWTRSLEKYILIDKGTHTQLQAAVDCEPNHSAFMKEKFPQALQIIKEEVETSYS